MFTDIQFLKAPENLKEHADPAKDERARLKAALKLNGPLALCYYMKERFRLLFQCGDKDVATKELTAWIREADASGIRILKDAAKQLMMWKPFILNWYKHRISTGKLEAMNRKIGTLQRNAYGYRDDYIHQLEYSRNLMFDKCLKMEEIFEGIVDRNRARLNIKRIVKIFGRKVRRRNRVNTGKVANREEVRLDKPRYNLTVFKIHFGYLTLKMYTKGECILRCEAISHNAKDLNCGGKSLEKFAAMINELSKILHRFLENMYCIDIPWLSENEFANLKQPTKVGETKVAGIDLDQQRMRFAIQAAIALSMKPDGFTAREHAAKVNELLEDEECKYTARYSAYDLKKLRGKGWVEKISPKSRHYQANRDGLRSMSATVLLRQKVIEPLLRYQGRAVTSIPVKTAVIDQHFRDIQHIMAEIFKEIHLADESQLTSLMKIYVKRIRNRKPKLSTKACA